MKMLLGIIAVLCWCGMLCGEDGEEKRLFTYALMMDIAAIVALHMI